MKYLLIPFLAAYAALVWREARRQRRALRQLVHDYKKKRDL